MKKLFWVLVVLSLVGSAGLLWLIKTMPHHDSDSAGHAHEHDASTEEHADHTHVQASSNDHVTNEKSTHKQELSAEHTDSEDTSIDIAHEAETTPKDVSKISSEVPQLSLQSDPSDADVYVDGEYYGKTPVQIALGGATKELRLEKEGYQSIKEVIPTTSKSKAKNIHWNLSLDKAKEAASMISLVTGVNGPAFVQLRALPIADFEAGRYGLNTNNYESLVGCKVELPGKGVWVRLLRGPYLKSMAQKVLSDSKKKYAKDAFVTGEQECLP